MRALSQVTAAENLVIFRLEPLSDKMINARLHMTSPAQNWPLFHEAFVGISRPSTGSQLVVSLKGVSMYAPERKAIEDAIKNEDPQQAHYSVRQEGRDMVGELTLRGAAIRPILDRLFTASMETPTEKGPIARPLISTTMHAPIIGALAAMENKLQSERRVQPISQAAKRFAPRP